MGKENCVLKMGDGVLDVLWKRDGVLGASPILRFFVWVGVEGGEIGYSKERLKV